MNPTDAVALGEAAAIAGETGARLGYALTNKALAEASAAAVVPLLALETTAILGGLATYAATEPAWLAASAAAAEAATTATAHWD